MAIATTATTTVTIEQLEQQVFDASAGQMSVTVILLYLLPQYFLMTRGLCARLQARNYQALTIKLTKYNHAHGGMFRDSLSDFLRLCLFAFLLYLCYLAYRPNSMHIQHYDSRKLRKQM